ncbi:MAG TPA: hypothetical protein VIJ25_06650, partial [Methylococcales bacterium]
PPEVLTLKYHELGFSIYLHSIIIILIYYFIYFSESIDRVKLSIYKVYKIEINSTKRQKIKFSAGSHT